MGVPQKEDHTLVIRYYNNINIAVNGTAFSVQVLMNRAVHDDLVRSMTLYRFNPKEETELETVRSINYTTIKELRAAIMATRATPN